MGLFLETERPGAVYPCSISPPAADAGRIPPNEIGSREMRSDVVAFHVTSRHANTPATPSSFISSNENGSHLQTRLSPRNRPQSRRTVYTSRPFHPA